MKILKNFYSLLCLIVLSFGFSQANAQFVINEISPSNLSQFQDNYGDYEDWIEIYNTSPVSLPIGGYHLSDDSLNTTKFMIPSGVTIGANGYLRLWCSGRGKQVGAHIHTSFKIKQCKNSNEWVILSDGNGVIIDYVEIKNSKRTQLGHSYGRTLDGGPGWSFFTNPTPNATNNNATPFSHYADKPNVNIGAGFYNSAQTIILTTNEPNSDIRYTLDGTLPTTSSTLYTGPITISTTKVLKAITFSSDPEVLPSYMEFNTYFINVSHTLRVVSIAANSLQTLANGSGSLRPHGTFELFDTLELRVAKTYGEYNRHGQDSWVLSQRSLDFISRDEMGYNHSVEDQIFFDTPRNNYQRLILRASGDDNYPADFNNANLGSTHLRDAFFQMTCLLGGMNLDVRRSEKCVVYINGSYWGVYDLRDNPDDHDNTNYYYNQDKYNLHFIETWGSTWAQYGGSAALNEWNALYNFILNNNLATQANYDYVDSKYDVTSLTDYILGNMFAVSKDWLNYNTGWWHGLDTINGDPKSFKWRYILWDNDATWGHYINYTNIPNTTPTAQPCDVEGLQGNSDPKGHVTVLNRLRMNPAFNNYYINRSVDLWNTAFSCANLLPSFDSTVALIAPEMTQHAARWGGSYTGWQNNVNQLRNFITQRCTAITSGYISCYSLTGPYDIKVNVDPPGSGSIQWNTITLNSFPWSAKYFGNVNLNVEALPIAPNSFTNWSANTQTFNPNATSAAASVSLTSGDSIVAHFSSTTFVEEIGSDELNPVVSAYPTMFNESTNIAYTLPNDREVTLKLFDITGKQLITFLDQSKVSKGYHKIDLNFANSSLVQGVYLLQFVAEDYSSTMKLVYTPNRY